MRVLEKVLMMSVSHISSLVRNAELVSTQSLPESAGHKNNSRYNMHSIHSGNWLQRTLLQ